MCDLRRCVHPVSSAHRVRDGRGFTLVELLVTVSVMSILMAIAVPSFARMIAANRLTAQTNELLASLNLARLEAVRRGSSVAIRATSSGTDFHKGWKIFSDSDADGALASETDVVRVQQEFAGSITVNRVSVSGGSYVPSTDADKAYIVFSGRGVKAAGGVAYFKICDAGDTSLPGRVVRVLNAGTVSLINTNLACG